MADELRTARVSRGLTQEQLAERSGVHQTTISDLEIGRVATPSWPTASRLADALGVSPADLFPVESSAS